MFLTLVRTDAGVQRFLRKEHLFSSEQINRSPEEDLSSAMLCIPVLGAFIVESLNLKLTQESCVSLVCPWQQHQRQQFGLEVGGGETTGVRKIA